MDLRKRALKGGKTVSRKQAANEYAEGAGAVPVSGASSQASSRNSSRAASSRAASRAPSEDEDEGNLSDETGFSIGSMEDLTEADIDIDNWTNELSNVIANIVDRKRSSTEGRELTFAAFARLCKFHPTHDKTDGQVDELLNAFCKSIKTESSEKEAINALRALELLSLNAYDNTIFEKVEGVLSRTIRDSTSSTIKASAIHCLGACSLFGGAGEDGMLDQMNFLIDIIASDGQSIDANDSAECVTAALVEWGHLATYVPDISSESEEAVQIFSDQLDSTDAAVQIAAGENIALLYEKTYTPRSYYEDDEDDEEDEENENDSEPKDPDEEELLNYSGPKLIKRYDAYHDTSELIHQLQSLAKAHSKRISKRDKKSLHSNFVSILTTVEDPRRGPKYSTVVDEDTGRHQGCRFRVKVGRDSSMPIDKWWKLIRLNSFRRLLQGGFSVHYAQRNRAMVENLPSVERWTDDGDSSSARWAGSKAKGKKGGRRSDFRKFAVHDDED